MLLQQPFLQRHQSPGCQERRAVVGVEPESAKNDPVHLTDESMNPSFPLFAITNIKK